MEIDKIQFENLRTLGITSSFDELDVDGNGKIDEKDLSKAKDTKISAQIDMLLNTVDEEAELVSISKAGAADDLDDVDDIADVEETEEADETETTDDAAEAGTTTAGSTENTGEYAKLQAQLTALNEEIAALNKQIESIEAENEELKKEKEALEAQQKAKSDELEKANAELAAEEDKLNVYMQEYADKQAEMDDLNKQILSEQNREQDEYDNDVKKFTNQAIDAYNPETDGDDFNAYFAKKMDSFGFPSFSRLNSLNDDASDIASSAETLQRNITTQSQAVYTAKAKATNISNELSVLNTKIEAKTTAINANNTKIASLQTDINTKNAEKAEVNKQIQALIPGGGLTASEVLSQISECEKNCAKELGWKLEECVIAQGEDGKFHIYPEPDGSGWKPGAVRAYYQAHGGNMYSDESFDLVPCGSGGICGNITDVTDSGGGRAVYRFSCVNDDWTDGEVCCSAGCYQTASPLSFDVNGDGVQTTNETVQYDIDGDGKLDTINNSAEWVLAFDKDGNGVAGENGSELFGNNTDLDGDGVKDGYKDGFEALKALALKEGLISSTDNMLDENDIRQLQEKYGLVMTNGYAGEAKSLTELGITQINLAATSDTTLEKNFDGRNNNIMRQEGATFVVNGEEREYADIWNAKKSSYEDTAKVESRLNPEMETFVAASTKVNEKFILKTNKEGVLALEGKVDFVSAKNSAINKVEAPKIDVLDEVVEENDDEDKDNKRII